jgi:hypothetical protein
MQYNTYYRKDVWEKFKDEADKSDLVNSLLSEHYGRPKTATESVILRDPPKPLPMSERIKVVDDIEIKPIRTGTNLCRVHGIPLTATGKCLQKGCKYS